MTFAKGLGNGFAIGGVVGRGDLLDGIRGNGISTFGGNPIATTAANATLDYVLSHDLQKNAAACGAIIIDGLKAAAGDLKVVADVRGKGLMFAVDLADPATGKPAPALAAKAMEETRQRGLLDRQGRPVRRRRCAWRPPLTLSEAEAREGLGLLRRRAPRPSIRGRSPRRRAHSHDQARHALDRRQALDGHRAAPGRHLRPRDRAGHRRRRLRGERRRRRRGGRREAGRAVLGPRLPRQARHGAVRLPRAGQEPHRRSSPR